MAAKHIKCLLEYKMAVPPFNRGEAPCLGLRYKEIAGRRAGSCFSSSLDPGSELKLQLLLCFSACPLPSASPSLSPAYLPLLTLNCRSGSSLGHAAHSGSGLQPAMQWWELWL